MIRSFFVAYTDLFAHFFVMICELFAHFFVMTVDFYKIMGYTGY